MGPQVEVQAYPGQYRHISCADENSRYASGQSTQTIKCLQVGREAVWDRIPTPCDSQLCVIYEL